MPRTTPAIPKDSALLKCERCGNAQRVWLEKCQRCKDPETNWYEDRIAHLEGLVETLDDIIREQADQLNRYSMELAKIRREVMDQHNEKEKY